jgi:hypothetical protein
MARFGGDDVEFGESRLVRRAMAEVAVDRRNELGLVPGDDLREPGEPIPPRAQIRISFGVERVALDAQEPRERLGGCICSQLGGSIHEGR